MKRNIALIIALTLCLQLFSFTAYGDEAPKRVSQLHVEGNRIYNEEGEQIKLVGTCIPSMEWAGGEKMDVSFDMSLDNWNSNVIRLPISTNGWYGKWWYVSDGGAKYRQDVRARVDQAAKRGKYVIIDLHHFGWIKEEDVKLWDEAAAMFKNEPAVIYNLLNEPHTTTWEIWRNGGTFMRNGVPEYAYGHQWLLDRIRNTGAKNLVVVGGLDWSYQLHAMVPGYDGLEMGYQLLEPEGPNKGHGIVYDTHIYPWKGGEDNWSRMVGVAFPYIPVFSGEFGHTNERLADWFDNVYYEYAYIWNNQLLNFYELNGVHYNAWCFHESSAPAALREKVEYEPTPYSGLITKFQLVHSEINNMPPVEERAIVDTKPVYEWIKNVDFDEVKPEVKVYKETDDTYITAGYMPDGVEGSCQTMAFDIPSGQEGKAAMIADFPSDWDFEGGNLITFRWRGDGDMRDMIAGVEMKDGRQFSTTFPINLNKNWQRNFYTIDTLKGPYGLLDPKEIKSFFFSPATAGKGSFSIDNVEIGGLNPKTGDEQPAKANYVESFDGSKSTWSAWSDNENTRLDSFTSVLASGEGVGGSSARKFTYVRPQGSFGGQARVAYDANWNLSNANYLYFDIKGDGSNQDLLFRLESRRAKAQKSGYYKREFERHAKRFTISSSNWQRIVFRLSDFGMSETFEKEKLGAMSIFNMTPNSKGTFLLDNITFCTDYDLGLEDSYELHPAPIESDPLPTMMPSEHPDNVIYQFCNEEEGVQAVGGKADDPTTPQGESDTSGMVTLNAGMKNYLHFTFRNKTDERVDGLVTIEGLPEGTIYEEQGLYVPYTVVWRQQNSVYFAFTLPDNVQGVYTIKVLDTYGKGVEAREYKVNIVNE